MKLKLLIAFIAILLTACSGDESDPVNDPIIEKDIKEIAYYEGDMFVGLIKFENNKFKERYLMVAGLEDYYTYDSQGRLIERVMYQNDEIVSTENITYDSSGRLVNITVENVDYYTVTEFDYTQQNKILRTDISYFEGSQQASTRFYHINDQGYISKIIYGEDDFPNSSEAVYSDNCLISVLYADFDMMLEDYIYHNTTNSYDMETEVKGQYININHNRFGSNQHNTVLASNFLPVGNKYLFSVIEGEYETQYVYEFDEDGFPVEVKRYINNELSSKEIITYE